MPHSERTTELVVVHERDPIRVGVGRDRRGGELDRGVGCGLLGGPVEAVGALGLGRGPAPDLFLDHGADIGGQVTGDPQRGEIEAPGQLETPPPVSLVGLLRGDGAPPASE